jgi:hypothetical protein
MQVISVAKHFHYRYFAWRNGYGGWLVAIKGLEDLREAIAVVHVRKSFTQSAFPYDDHVEGGAQPSVTSPHGRYRSGWLGHDRMPLTRPPTL